MDRIGTFEGSNLGWSKAARRASKGIRPPIIPGNRTHLYTHDETHSANCCLHPLLTPAEVGALGWGRLVILAAGMPPVLAYKHPHFRDRELQPRAGLLPPRG